MEFSQGSSLIMIKNYIFHTLPDMITSSFNPRIINHEFLLSKYQWIMYQILYQQCNPHLFWTHEWKNQQCSMSWSINIWEWGKKVYLITFHPNYFIGDFLVIHVEMSIIGLEKTSAHYLGQRIILIKIPTFGVRIEINLLSRWGLLLVTRIKWDYVSSLSHLTRFRWFVLPHGE